MLSLSLPAAEFFDEETQLFQYTKATVLTLEHSLVSISKWESKWRKPFFSKEAKTDAETLDYVRCMTVTQKVNPLAYRGLGPDHIRQIQAYIEEPMTATWFKEKPRASGREIVTSEVIYYWMIALGIPFECEKWHLNRLLTLIRVCNEKQQPHKGQKGRQALAQRQALNRARRAQFNTRG